MLDTYPQIGSAAFHLQEHHEEYLVEVAPKMIEYGAVEAYGTRRNH